MLAYNIRLALKSLRRNPVVAALMIGAIALGVGVCITMLTVFRLMSGNPIAHRNDVLYAVTMDAWDPDRAWDDENPKLAPPELTYRDATAMYESDIPDRKVIMRKGSFVLDPVQTGGAKPFVVEARLASKDFFTMFDVPFMYGNGWDDAADRDSQLVIVLSKETNEKAFGGQNSVGRTLRLDGRDFKVIGVLDDWAPTPKFYDLNNGAFDTIEDIFAPFSIGETLQVQPAGNVNCWRNQPVDSQETFLASDCTWIQEWVELRTPEKVAAFQNLMDNYASEQKKLGRFERPLNNHLTRPGDWLKVNEVVRDDNRVLVGLSFMFLAVCLLNMIGLLLAKFLGAAPVVGLRRALGASKGAIFRQHLVEVGVIGFCGGALGILIAALGLMGIRKLYEHYDELTRLDFTMVLITLGIAVLSGVVAGLYPTWRVCSIQPAGQLKTQ
jgi:putative ABC transport system permease protein